MNFSPRNDHVEEDGLATMRAALMSTEAETRKSSSPASSEISSLDGDDYVTDLMNPESRKFINDKEYLKFVMI